MTGSQKEPGPRYNIRPTGPALFQNPQYSDTALGNLLALHGAQINSVRQAIWQRYAARLSMVYRLANKLEVVLRTQDDLFN